MHDLIAKIMQTCKCSHELVKDIDQMWRHLEWDHYKHVKLNTQWSYLKFLEMNTHNIHHIHNITYLWEIKKESKRRTYLQSKKRIETRLPHRTNDGGCTCIPPGTLKRKLEWMKNVPRTLMKINALTTFPFVKLL